MDTDPLTGSEQNGTQPSLPWQSRLVWDLAWSIGSPPLVQSNNPSALWPDADWYLRQLNGFRDELTALDSDEAARALALSGARDRRLGAYFEALLGLWLQRDPRYELLARNLAVRRPRKGGGRETLGELDMLVMNRARERVEHWEVAVKFYLGGLPGTPATTWVGPGLKDRLDIKVSRLLDHQLRLPRQSDAESVLEERGLAVQASRVIMKGRLFYPIGTPPGPPPAAAPGHLRGWWMRLSEFPGPFARRDWSWRRLGRKEWLAPVLAGTRDDPMPLDHRSFAESEQIAAATWPRMVAALSGNREVTRGFVVPDGWGAQAPPEGSRSESGRHEQDGEAGP